VQVPIIRFKYFSWHMQLGMGAGVMTRPFDPIVNPENVLISLYVTPYINIQTGIDVKVTPQFDITLNGSFMHSSNAATNMPNYGINEATALLGLRLHFNKSANLPSMWKKHQDTLAKFQPVNSLFFTVEPFFLWARYDDYYYFKTIAQIGYMRHALSILSFGASLDFTLANRLTPSRDVEQMQKTPGVINDLELAARRDRVEYTDMPKNIATVGAYAFGEINFGRFIFHVGLGGYIYKGGGPNDGPGHWFNMHRQIELDDNDMPVAGTGSGSIAGDFDLSEASRWSENGGTLHKNPWMFEKVGFRIELGKKRNHFVGAYIRAHAPVADYLCFQYGYKFVNFKDVKKK
jgi:hypothetical protein